MKEEAKSYCGEEFVITRDPEAPKQIKLVKKYMYFPHILGEMGDRNKTDEAIHNETRG